MARLVSLACDVKTAVVLAGSAGLLGAAAVPFPLPWAFELIPPEQRTLPLPLPLFCLALAFQFLLIYGLLALAGLRLARVRGGNRRPFSAPSGWGAVRATLAGRRPRPLGPASCAGLPWSPPWRPSGGRDRTHFPR